MKLLPLCDQDLADVIALLLDNPDLDATVFWENCHRTGNTDHVLHQLNELEQGLKDGTFRQAWRTSYPEDVRLSETLSVIQAVQSLNSLPDSF